MLDGEVCALDEEGRATFSAMQQGKPGTRYLYVAFDVLEVDGEPVVDLPYTERRKRLEKLLDKRNTHRAVLGVLRRRRRALRGREAAALRGDHGQAPAVAVPARPPYAATG